VLFRSKVLYGKGRLPAKLPATVYPSARISNRVPFGTGQKIADIIAGASPPAYPDAVYEQIGTFIAIIDEHINTHESCGELSARTKTQLPAVYDFLSADNFFQSWEKIRAQHHGMETELSLRRAFQFWFDGLKIIRLIHWLDS
jgi:hypothetical protein